jgi:hypothetical protein
VRAFQIASTLVLTLALAACSRSEAPPVPSQTPAVTPPVEAAPPPGPSAPAAAKPKLPRVASVDLGSALDPTKRVLEAKSAFAPTDTIYASIATEGWGEPIALTARWTFEDGQLVSESQTLAEPGPGITEFHIEKADGWPVGSYQLEILAGEASVSTQRFEVR